MASPRFAANVSTLFCEHAFLDRFAAAARAGFTAVEFWWPQGETRDDIVAAVGDAGLDVVLINFDGGDIAAGERGLLNDPGQEVRFEASIPTALALATALGCRYLNALVGIELPGPDRSEQLAHVRANLAHAARSVAAAGITVLVEAINTYDVGPYLVSDTAAAEELVRSTGEPNVALQYDVFHMHRMGEDVDAALRRHARLIAHVQIADAPGRGEPGSGEIDFERLFATLGEIGYAGHIGVEYVPSGATEASLGWRERWL